MANLIEFIAHPYSVTICRWMIACVLLIAGISKLYALNKFVSSVIAYELLPMSFTRLVGRLLPVVEVLVGIMLLVGWWTRVAAIAAIVLFITFTLVMGINLLRGRNLECNCFGKLGVRQNASFTLLRNLVLLCCTVITTVYYAGYASLEATVYDWTLEGQPQLLGLFASVGLIALLVVATWMISSVLAISRSE